MSEQSKHQKSLPDHIDKERLKLVFFATNMNPELCGAECGVDSEEIAKWIEEDRGEIAEWKRAIYVRAAIDAFNQLIDIAKNEPKRQEIDAEGNEKKKPYASDAQVKAISILLDRLGHLIGIDPSQKQEKPKEKRVAIISAEEYLKAAAKAE